jgi:hypothetical protein
MVLMTAVEDDNIPTAMKQNSLLNYSLGDNIFLQTDLKTGIYENENNSPDNLWHLCLLLVFKEFGNNSRNQ